MSGKTTIACANCGRALDERSDLSPEQREPCPVCGSTARSFNVSVSSALAVASAVTATVKKTRLGSSPVDESTPAEAIRGQYRATLDWYILEGDFWMLQVLNDRGELVDGGIGDNAEDALLEVYERLIPPR